MGSSPFADFRALRKPFRRDNMALSNEYSGDQPVQVIKFRQRHLQWDCDAISDAILMGLQ